MGERGSENGHLFRPLRFLGNAHVQTVLGSLLPGPRLLMPSVERAVGLPDGDRLVLHDSVPAGWRAGDPVALLVHGLGGSHRSGSVRRVARLLCGRGWRAVRVDLRGCGRGIALARRPYHAGCSEDVRAALEDVESHCPGSPLALVGFSLGGNIVLKLAGEAAGRPLPALGAVAAVSPPVDLARCSAQLSRRRNRLYELHFLSGLIELARRRSRIFPDDPLPRFPRRLTLRRFDDLYTAPRAGFADAADYYRRASSLPLLARIGVPTLVLTARDDPFIAVEPLEGLAAPAHVEVRIVPYGGHLGFLGADGLGGVRWGEGQVVDWLGRWGVGRSARNGPSSVS